MPGKEFRPGDDCCGAVVVRETDAGLTLRCGCDATFPVVGWFVGLCQAHGIGLRCPGCGSVNVPAVSPAAPRSLRVPVSETERGHEVVRLRKGGVTSYAELTRLTGATHNEIYKALKKARLCDPGWRQRPRPESTAVARAAMVEKRKSKASPPAPAGRGRDRGRGTA